ncbi:ATP-grasp enzyme-like protein [Sarocladium implicatum]|nr:ATP-grasp enzyme-like protein [Sarocladium implicatum]
MASLPTPAGHLLKNIALLAISLLLLPLNTAIFLAIDLLSRLTANHGVVKSIPRENRKTILVTGVNMTKGLVLARLFHKAGHRVIGADTNPLAPGRLSRALDEFHVLPRSDASGVEDPYIKSLLAIIQKDSVDLWVSASDVNGAMADALAKDLVEKQTSAKAVQFGDEAISTLHEKDTFMKHTESLGLTIPDSEVVRDRESVISFLTKRGGLEKKQGGVQYLVKPIGVDDLGRNDMPLLPLDSEKETLQRIEAMPFPKTDKPAYIIQQFITGPEYCTHALIVRGQVRSFVACPSSDMLMHYTALPASSALHRAMLEFTQKQAASFGDGLTGHMSFDFLIQQGEEMRMEEKMEESPTLYPIECNPRVHTAVVLLRDTLDTVDSYISVLSPSSTSRPLSSIDFIPSHPQQYYWIGHDLVELVLYHLYLTVVVGTMTPSQYCESLRVFANHVVNWQDGLLETWDPWPCWWLYHVYWPVQFAGYLFNGRWHKINVSTGKAFKAA